MVSNTNMIRQRACPVCPRADRDWIETLMAAGAYYDDLRIEFGIRVIDLRRHESLHSTKQPSVDPLTLLREVRWLNEQAAKMVRRELAKPDKAPNKDILGRRMNVIGLALRVLHEYSTLVDAPKHLDQNVVLPRWHQVIMKLSERLKNIPGAVDALVEWAKEEGPQGAGVTAKTEEVQSRIEQEKANPSFKLGHHSHHTCPRCNKTFRCFDLLCVETVEVCRVCRKQELGEFDNAGAAQTDPAISATQDKESVGSV